MAELVGVEVEEGVAVVTLSDPARRNALTLPMRDALIACFDELEQTGEVAAMVLTGAGSSFCAGADLGDLAAAGPADFRPIYDAFLRVARSTLPTLAAVNGPAVGAGLNLALACDIRFAARSARFISRFLQLGLHPGGGNTWMLSSAVGSQVAASMLMFGEELDGEAALRYGLAHRCVDDELLLPEARLFAAGAAGAPRPLVARLKQTLQAIEGVDRLDDAVAVELEAQVWSSKQAFFRERIAHPRKPRSPA